MDGKSLRSPTICAHRWTACSVLEHTLTGQTLVLPHDKSLTAPCQSRFTLLQQWCAHTPTWPWQPITGLSGLVLYVFVCFLMFDFTMVFWIFTFPDNSFYSLHLQRLQRGPLFNENISIQRSVVCKSWGYYCLKHNLFIGTCKLPVSINISNKMKNRDLTLDTIVSTARETQCTFRIKILCKTQTFRQTCQKRNFILAQPTSHIILTHIRSSILILAA